MSANESGCSRKEMRICTQISVKWQYIAPCILDGAEKKHRNICILRSVQRYGVCLWVYLVVWCSCLSEALPLWMWQHWLCLVRCFRDSMEAFCIFTIQQWMKNKRNQEIKREQGFRWMHRSIGGFLVILNNW